ncbi:MAG: DUF4296 domain-containing protein [Bacteroidia bacterium]|nr:DUF4296 domain-containing protein [Bacteroidia bacterium]
MKSPAVHTLALAVAISLLLSCRGADEKVIPRGKLSRIYEELYLADRWADSKSEYRLQVDTTDFYESILESYGYTAADYRASVDFYLNDPERFSRILKKAAARLKARSKELDKSADRIREIQQMLQRAKSQAPEFEALTDMTLDSLMKLVSHDYTFHFAGRIGESGSDSVRAVSAVPENVPLRRISPALKEVPLSEDDTIKVQDADRLVRSYKR